MMENRQEVAWAPPNWYVKRGVLDVENGLVVNARECEQTYSDDGGGFGLDSRIATKTRLHSDLC